MKSSNSDLRLTQSQLDHKPHLFHAYELLIYYYHNFVYLSSPEISLSKDFVPRISSFADVSNDTMDTSTGQIPTTTHVFDLNKAIADLHRIAEARPQSDPAMTITIRRTDLILAKVEEHVKSLEKAYIKRHEEIESLKNDQLANASEAEATRKEAEAKLDEAKTFADHWREKNEELAQRLEKASDYAERLRQREQEQIKAEQELKGGQRILREEQARSNERLAKDQHELSKAQERLKENEARLKEERGRLEDERKELGEAQERLTAQKHSSDKSLRDSSGALDVKRDGLEKSQEAHDLKVAKVKGWQQ